MKTNVKKLFYFTRSERSGIALLSLLCVFLFWLPSRFTHLSSREAVDFSAFQREIAEFEAHRSPDAFAQRAMGGDTINPNVATEKEMIAMGMPARTARTLIKYRSKGGHFRYKEDLKKIYTIDEELYVQLAPYIDLPSKPSETEAQVVLARQVTDTPPTPFDPNTASKDELLSLGFPDRVANTLINYRSKGGIFRRKEDVRKVYGLSEALYDRLAPFIRIAGASEPLPGPGRSTNDQDLEIDINQASAEEWRRLRGIGPVLSTRIVKFREKLGGFVRVEQVAETYGLPDSTFQRIAGRLVASPIRDSLRINRVSIEELQAHPYVNWRQAKAIVRYRINHGPLRTQEDFGRIRALTEEERARIAPYLSFE